MKTPTGFMLSSGEFSPEITPLPSGTPKEVVLMTGQGAIEETGYWFGKMGFATLRRRRRRRKNARRPAGSRRRRRTMIIIITASTSTTSKGFSRSSSSRCPTKSTTMAKGKVAADHSHKWIYNKEPNDDQEISFLSAWHTSADSHPRTWEAQFRSGIKTLALIAVREGVIQLGAVHKVVEDLSYVVSLRKKFGYIESIPGVLLPHPSSSGYPTRTDGSSGSYGQEPWLPSHFPSSNIMATGPPSEYYDHHHHHHHFNHHYQPAAAAAAMVKTVTPSMTSLEALLSKLPSVVPTGSSGNYCDAAVPPHYVTAASGGGLGRPQEMVAKEEYDEGEYEDNNNNYEDNINNCKDVGESSSSMSYNHHHHNYGYHYDLNVRDYN